VPRAALVLGLLLTVLAAAPAAARPAPDRGAPALHPVTTEQLSPRLVEHTFATPGLSPPFAETKVRVLLPRDLGAGGRRHPVVLLLHGIGDDHRSWTTNQDGWPTKLEDFTADKDVIVVMPQAGANAQAGWYSDWFNDGAFGAPAWETFHLVQLLGFVDRAYPTRPDRNGRVVAGLSMGGYGAMSYAARHPDLFAGAFAFSGAVDNETLAPYLQATYPGLYGDRARHEIRWDGHNPPDLVGNLRDVELMFRTGRGVPGGPAPRDNEPPGLALEAVVGETNEVFARALRAAGVEHDYEDYTRGGHNWWHWQRGLQEVAWPRIERVFARRDPAPARFDYASTEPAFSIWGWDVAVERDGDAFLRLQDTGRDGVGLAGAGRVTLATPPEHRPATRHVLTGTAGARVAETVVRSDAAGRLRFAVDLDGAGRVGIARACTDTTRPRSRVLRPRVRDGRLTVAGVATDAGCADESRVDRVVVSIARRQADGRCRPVGPRGFLGRPRDCARTRYVPARGTSRFSLRVPRRLPAGRYIVWSRAIDADGNVERKARTRNLARPVVR
jgi:S-formylglutathione hydrolase FrmB